MTEQIKIDFEKTIKSSDIAENDVNLKKQYLSVRSTFHMIMATQQI